MEGFRKKEKDGEQVSHRHIKLQQKAKATADRGRKIYRELTSLVCNFKEFAMGVCFAFVQKGCMC